MGVAAASCVINNNINNINNNIISLREDERTTLADDLILCEPPKWRLLLVKELYDVSYAH